jgi:hypothetical protein
LLFLILSLSLHSSCNSEISAKLNSAKIAKPKSSFQFSLPTKNMVSQADAFSIDLNKLTGDEVFKISFLEQSTLGTANCADVAISDTNSSTPTLNISNCTGNGGIIFKYGSNSSLEIHINNTSEQSFSQPFAVAIGNSNTFAYVVDYTLDALIRVDLRTGTRQIISNSSNGTGDNFKTSTGIAITDDEATAYVIDSGSPETLFSVNIATGNRTIVSNNIIGSGANFNQPTRVIINSNEDKAYIVDRNSDALYEVDLTTGNRIIVSDSGTGTGTNFLTPYGLALNTTENIVYIADRDIPGVLEVDLLTGNRVIISDNSTGLGVDFSNPHGIQLDPSGNTAYVLDNSKDAIFQVDLATGNRQILSDSSNGIGINFSSPLGLGINLDGSKLYVVDSADSVDALIEVDISTGNRVIKSK